MEGHLTTDHEAVTPQGVYPLLRGIDASVREFRDEYYDDRRDMSSRISRMEEEISGLKREMTDVKISAGVMEHRLSDVTDSVKGLREAMTELKGDMKALTAQMNMLQGKIGWYISLLGVGLTVAIAVVQVLVK